MRIHLLNKKKIVAVATSAALCSSSLYALELPGSGGITGAASKAKNVVTTTGKVQGVINKTTSTVDKMINNYISDTESLANIFNGMIRLKCLRKKKTSNADLCGNFKKFGNFLAYLSNKGFSLDLKVCEFSGDTPDLMGLYNHYIDEMCREGESEGSKIEKIEYNPVVSEITVMPEYSTISYSSDRIVKNDEEIVYPSGITRKVLYSGGGVGYFAYKANRDRSSDTALSYIRNDVPTLVLKDIAIKSIGKDNEVKMGLPKNKEEAVEITEKKAMARYVEPMMDWGEFMDKVEGDLSNKFMQINVGENDTESSVREKEYQIWKDYVEQDSIQNIYKKQEDMVKSIFSDIELLRTTQKDYIFDPSQARIDLLPLSADKNKEKYKSLVQMTKDTIAKGVMGQAIKYKKQLLDISLKKAYVSATPFRGEVVRNEINKILENVDNLIQ